MRSLASLTALLALSTPGLAFAQAPPSDLHVPLPGRTLATGDDASALTRNPANLSYLPAGELRWTWLRTGQDATSPVRGHAISAATPLFWGLSLGAGMDFVQPPDASGAPTYNVSTLGLAFKPNEAFSLGLSGFWTSSGSATFDRIAGANVGTSIRPSKYFALAGTLREGSQSGQHGVLFRAWDLGLALRPTGRRAFEIGLEASKSQSATEWVPRGVLGLDIPWLGRLRGDVQVTNPADSVSRAYVATIGLDLNAPYTQLVGGGVFGTGLGQGQAGFYTGLALRGFRENGAPAHRHYVKLRFEGTPGTREHVRLLRALWRAADSPEIAGVALVMKAEPSSSMAHSEELGDAIRMLRSRGKKVFCHLEDAGGRALYVCAQADRTVINPAGGIRFAGLRLQYQYYGALAKKVGVNVEMVRIGAHKTAAEEFTRSTPTPVADADHADLLAQFQNVFLSDVGGGRKISAPELQLTLGKGPFLAREAKEARLVDGYAFDDELESVAHEVEGAPVRVVDLSASPAFAREHAQEMGERERVAIVYVDGMMIDGRSRDVPILEQRLAGSRTIAESLKAAREDPRVRSIVLRIESPGGSSMAAEVMWREVALAAKQKPVIVSMGSSAASGGYYVAAPANVIFANRSTLTGSIGIYYGKADVSELFGKLGIGTTTYRQTPRADAESMYRPYTDDERVELGRKVKMMYDTFVDRVARGRGMTADQVDAVARGHVWTGEQALQHHLVDRLGGLREALDEAKRRGGLGRDAPIVELPVVPANLLSTVLRLGGFASTGGGAEGDEPVVETSIPIPRDLITTGRSMLPFLLFDGATPMMHLEGIVETP